MKKYLAQEFSILDRVEVQYEMLEERIKSKRYTKRTIDEHNAIVSMLKMQA